jgi:hypothetical protein
MIAEDPITESTKSQITNNKQITMTKIPNPKLVSSGTTALNCVSVIECWDLGLSFVNYFRDTTLVGGR